MIKQYFKQALAQLRQHPLISVISIAGTALSIFLIMLVVMLQQVKVAPFSPESNRDRFLHVPALKVASSYGFPFTKRKSNTLKKVSSVSRTSAPIAGIAGNETGVDTGILQ